MLKKVRLCLLVCFFSIFITGCYNLNPFAPPEAEETSDQQIDEYMDDVEKKIEDSEKKADEDAKNFEENFDKKNEEIYYNAMNEMLEPDTDDSDDGIDSIMKRVLRSFYKTYVIIKISGVGICIGSIVLGAIGAFFSRHNKSGMKFFIITFCIVVPLLLVLIVFGVGVLNQLFIG